MVDSLPRVSRSTCHPKPLGAQVVLDMADAEQQVHEMDSLDHPAVLHVETGHDSYRFHGVHASFQQGERVVVPKHCDEMTRGARDDEQMPNEVAVADPLGHRERSTRSIRDATCQ